MIAADPVTIEVLRNDFSAIAEEMAVVVWKTARSPHLKSGDFSTTLADAQGRVLAQGFGASFQLPCFEELFANVLQRYCRTLRPGDVCLCNDPALGMTHLPDVAVVVPVFWKKDLVAFCAIYSHHSDIGGRFPGGMSSQPTSSYEEGMRIPLVKIYDRGLRNDPLFELLTANVRVPDEFVADVEVKVAGCGRGGQGMINLLERHGLDPYRATCDHLVEHAERATRAAIAQVPDGTYRAEDVLDDRGLPNAGPITLRLTLTVSGDRMLVDFEGSSAQVPAAVNLPFVMTRAAVYGAINSLLVSDAPVNSGFYRPIEVRAPRGSIVNPVLPAPVGGRAVIMFRILDMFFRALGQAMPTLVPVPGEAGDMVHLSGVGPGGDPFAVADMFFGGWGARPSKDGVDGVGPVYGGSYGCISTEVLESQFPLMVEAFQYLQDSAGPGRYRGSMAVEKTYRLLAAAAVMVRQTRLQPSPGLEGGEAGDVARTIVSTSGGTFEPEQETHIHFEVEAGDRVTHVIGGAGGHGDPFSREPQWVLEDVVDGRVSVKGALRDYGVVIAGGRVDEAATAEVRNRA